MLFFLLFCQLMISRNAKGNIALNKATLQSSLYTDIIVAGSGHSHFAVDGNTAQKLVQENKDPSIICSHTDFFDSNAWWAVDLGAVYDVSSVVLYGRNDCCSFRFSNFDIDVIKPNGCTTLCHYQADNTTFLDATCPVNTVGRYVRVRLRTRNSVPLAICEAQVYGHAYVEVPTGVLTYSVCMVDGHGYLGTTLSETTLKSKIRCILLCSITPECSAGEVNMDTKVCSLKKIINVNKFYQEEDAFYSDSDKSVYFIN